MQRLQLIKFQETCIILKEDSPDTLSMLQNDNVDIWVVF
jgi:hypothetical protein